MHLVRMSVIAFCAVWFGAGCVGSVNKRARWQPPPGAERALSPEQITLIQKHDAFLEKLWRHAALSGAPSWEVLRPHLAAHFGLPRDASWGRIFAEDAVRRELTEEKRRRYAAAFLPGLDPDDEAKTGWVKIHEALEKARTPAAAGPTGN